MQMQRFQQKYHDEYTTVIPENAFAERKSAEDLKRRRSVSKDSPERQREKEKKCKNNKKEKERGDVAEYNTIKKKGGGATRGESKTRNET